MTNYIWVTTQFEGFHKYPQAPEGVEFLKDLHRHMFYLRVSIQVFLDDRDIEFILFKRYINSLITKNNFDYKSCEMISNDLNEKITQKYPNRKIKIIVSEDNENGSEYEYKN